MKVESSFISLLFVLHFTSCTQIPNYGAPVVEPATILNSSASFQAYWEGKVKLHEDFTPLDTSSNVISKKVFLKFISSGDYLPLRLKSTDTSNYYKLYKLDERVNKDIKYACEYWGLNEYVYYESEGKELPEYNFVDMEGKVYTKQNTKGKILVLKCWFIDCLPCRNEMPALNELKQQYKNRNDILFVSICWDHKKDVSAFLKKTRFDYAIVPDQYKFLTEVLQLNGYPTHFVINKQGLIIEKANDYRAMAYILKKESSR